MQMHAKENEKSVEWKRSDMKSAKQSGKMDVPSMFDVVSVCRLFGIKKYILQLV